MKLSIKYRDFGSVKRFKEAPTRIQRAVLKVLEKHGKDSVGRVQARLEGRGTGELARAVSYTVKVLSTGPTLTVGVLKKSKAQDYAAIQEYGGIIKPKRRKYLAVPTDAVRAGNRTLTTDEARSFFDTFVKRIGKSRTKLGIFTRKGSEISMLYRLITSIRIRKNPYLAQELTILPRLISRDLAQYIAESISK